MGLNHWILLFVFAVTNVTAMETAKDSPLSLTNEPPSFHPLPPYTTDIGYSPDPSSFQYQPSFSIISFRDEKDDFRFPIPKIEPVYTNSLNDIPSAPLWDLQEETRTGLQMPFQTEFQAASNSNSQALAPYNPQEQMQLSLSPSPQYVMIPQEDLLKLMQSVIESKNEQKEMKEMMQILLSQGDKQVEVLEQIEQGQMTLTGEIETLKGKISKVTQQLTNPNQSTFEKTCNWGGLLFKAGLSGATALTTYGALVPALGLLPSFIAPPLAVPILFASYSGLHLFAKLV